MNILRLGADAALINQIARLLYAEWGHLAAWGSEARIVDAYEERVSAPEKGVTLVAVEGSKLLGTASLKPYELPHYLDKKWWLSEVIIAPEHRGLGIGRLLVRDIVAQATDLGIEELFLYTAEREIYYAQMGWTSIGQDRANGEANVIMRRSCKR